MFFYFTLLEYLLLKKNIVYKPIFSGAVNWQGGAKKMELMKKNIHMNRIKCKSNVQLTLDDDYNVPDVKPDIDKIIKEQGNIHIQDITPSNGRFSIKGGLDFTVLYASEDEEHPIHSIKGVLPFEEIVNMDSACEEDDIRVKWELDDMTTSLINSRKINVKAIISLDFTSEDVSDEEAAIGIDDEEEVEYQNKEIDITELVLSKKDTFRIKDEVSISLGKPNISEILYSEFELQNMDTRLMENQVSLKGDLRIFLLYTGDTQEQQVEYYDLQIPINGNVDCDGCDDRMISDIDISILTKDMQVKPDDDGEERILDLEIVLELDMKVYEEEQLEVLNDLYSVNWELVPMRKEAAYKNLLLKNNSKVRLLESIALEQGQPLILQICNASGSIKIDSKEIVENGIMVEGVLEVQLLYIAEEDKSPLGAAKGVIPFSQLVEIKDIMPDSTYDMRASIDQLNTLMVSGDEVEVKASINLDTIVFNAVKESIITEVDNNGSLLEKIQELPSMVAYTVDDGDSLWTIAKEFYTTVDNIKEMNHLENEFIKKGDKLLLIKAVDTVLE